jgi:hypothetical protein
VDSVNVFNFIDEILNQPFNNPMQTFEKFSDIEGWLREQWAGLFRDLLNRRSEQSQLSTLSSEVKQLGELNTTLKRYMETLLKASKQPGSEQVIQQEDKRLDEARIRGELRDTYLIHFLGNLVSFKEDEIIDKLFKTNSFEEFVDETFTDKEFKELASKDELFKRAYKIATDIIKGVHSPSKSGYI